MEKSKLENIGNTQLFYLLKSFVSISDETNPDMDDYNLSNNCDEASRIVGIELTFPVDQNYIVATLHLNSGYDFSTQKPNGEIKRPSFGLYEFDVDEHRTEQVIRTYRHTMVSYDESLVISTCQMAEGEGWFDYTEGKEVDVEGYDGETTEVNYDNRSVTKIS